MCGWERKKAFYLIQVAEEIGMSCLENDCGEIGVNENSGNVYL